MRGFVRIPRGMAPLIASWFALALTHPLPISAQQSSTSAATTAVQDAATKGFPLTSSSTDVTGNVSVEAVLIPARIGKTVFGKEISNNYAVIALTISNRSSDYSFVVHSVFIDYSEWLLSGRSPVSPQSNPVCSSASQTTNVTSSAVTAQETHPEQQQSKEEQSKPVPGWFANCLKTWQQQTLGNQIDSVENRIVRGELLDRQPWMTRNWVLRALQAAGSIATGFTFATSSQSWIRGIGAFNGVGIPAAQTLWPDATVGQMNRISDVGFQVNKVVAKQSADIVVAFFPIDRFLTPDLASLFISSPAAFFVPFAAIKDPQLKGRLTRYKIWGDEDADNLMAHLFEVVSGKCLKLEPDKIGTAASGTLEKACQTAELVNRLSLNVVRLRVAGTMTVDVGKVPPQITEIEIEEDRNGTATWAKGTTLTGVIRGSFLGGGTPDITAPDSKLFQVSVVAEGSSDTELHFKITLSDNLPRGTSKLSFQVSKKSDGSTITTTQDYTIQTAPKGDSSTGTGSGDASQVNKPQIVPSASPTGTPKTTPTKPKM